MAAVSISSQDNTLVTAAEVELRAMLVDGTTGGRTIAGPLAGVSLPQTMVDMFLLQMLALFREVLTKQGAALPPFTVGTLPSAGGNTGRLVYVSDEAGGAVPAFSDGASWRRVTDRAVVS